MSETASAIIDRLGLQPHPEGGWFRETWRADAAAGSRANATAIYFLLEAGTRSHWHRVDATEIWLWHAGVRLDLALAEHGDGPVLNCTLGPDVLAGDAPQRIVPTGWWQAARPQGGWVLVSCIVSPGFEFAGFELAPEGWAPGGA